MLKLTMLTLSGVFIGAVAYELLNRTKPELTDKIEDYFENKIDDLLYVAS